MDKKVLKLFLISITLSFFFCHGIKNVQADDVYEIHNSSELAYYALMTHTSEYQNTNFKLVADITISEEDQAALEQSDYSAISFGTSDYPYQGVFDGNGHTISNLKYNATKGMDHDNGLFSYTDGATIKNLIIDNAEIRSYFRGGVLVGYANNTRIENVIVKNSHLFVTAADNVLTVVTDGGVRGGALAGDAFNSVIYNCEGENNFVNTNSTSGVAAIAGKGLTLAGLVGISNNTEVEYSRIFGGRISNYYDVAVGALGGNTLYVGGIIGQMQGNSKVIDCFSTAELYFYCATYVAVGAGNTGHIGGITAKMDGTGNEIYRSHYAGVATSRQYNAVVLVPIVQNNVNISGITDIYEGGPVVSSYFKPSLNNDVNMGVLGNNTSTTSYGPLDDAKYINKDYWQEQSYDFLGTTKRSSSYSDRHYNKWVIDYNLQIPVHGKSLSTTLDFKGAGEVSIAASELVSAPVSTTNPYQFAVQGMKAHEVQTTIEAKVNEGYQFVGWYKIPSVAAWSLEEDYSYFKDVLSTTPIESTEKTHTITINDNDLYIAKYQAKVTYHDYQGNVIDTNGNQTLATQDYYDYHDTLPDVTPSNAPNSQTATLIGWTTIPSQEGGYSSITSTELNNIKNQNEFYLPGEKIEKTLNLYPIYVDLLSNINLVFEGSELDPSTPANERGGVGSASLSKQDEDTAILSINGADNGNLPDGYRFLGWYDENDRRVSKDLSYTLDLTELDLTTTHTYTAKLEYRVDYKTRAFHQDNNAFGNLEDFKTIWYKYQEEFISIGSPAYIREYITHWGTSSVDHGQTDNLTDAFSGPITEPVIVYSHNYTTVNGNQTGYQVYGSLDFPGSGDVTPEQKYANTYFRFTPVSDRYHLAFWTFERSSNGRAGTFIENPMDTAHFETLDVLVSTSNYQAMAFVNTDIVFHKKDDTTKSVLRRYQNNVFLAQDVTETYTYPFVNTGVTVDETTKDGGKISSTITLESSPSDAEMQVAGYYFLGWISSTEVEPNSAEWNSIYDAVGDSYTTTNMKKAIPYLADPNMLVEETMDLYPVYARYNISTATNVSAPASSGINIPPNPSFTVQDNNDGTRLVTLTPDMNTFVQDGGEAKFTLYSLTVTINDGEEIEVIPENGVYTYTIEAGKTYVFTANYEPYVILFHLNDTDMESRIKNQGQEIGQIPQPTYQVPNNYVFVGYTKTAPQGGYHLFNNKTSFEASGITTITSTQLVSDSMDLYPVYVGMNVTLNSNIDSYLEAEGIDKNTIYHLEDVDISNKRMNVLTPKVGNYHFIGWYQNYQDDNHKGTLITINQADLLDKDKLLEGNTYTAVYETAYEVRYHAPDGSILTSAYIKNGEIRTFVETIEEDDKEIEVPIDADAYSLIYQYLDSSSFLNTYQWIKNDNTIIPWDDYKNNTITSDMDLYPVIYQVSAFDSNNQALSINEDNSNLLIGMDDGKISVVFNETYTDPELTIHINQVETLREGNNTTNKQGVEVNIFKNISSEEPLQTESTNSSGDAIFTFKATLEITKVSSDANEETDIFVFKIVNQDTSQEKEVLIRPGETIKIKLPYGNYEIIEDNNWAWRYQNLSANFSLDSDSISPKITLNNTLINTQWFDAMNYKKNRFE